MATHAGHMGIILWKTWNVLVYKTYVCISTKATASNSTLRLLNRELPHIATPIANFDDVIIHIFYWIRVIEFWLAHKTFPIFLYFHRIWGVKFNAWFQGCGGICTVYRLEIIIYYLLNGWFCFNVWVVIIQIQLNYFFKLLIPGYFNATKMRFCLYLELFRKY